jgi:diguanylate cyclase (GGDEF)-like protein/PAS domain S-box-containing protein
MNHVTVRVLLVEDDAVDRLACRRALAAQPGYVFEVEEADTARAGLQRAHAEAPDLILLDYHLPDMDGLEFLAELAADSGEMPVPVMLLTGAQDISIAVDAMRRGARDYLVKDGQGDYLKLLPTVIQRVLRESQAHADKRAAEERLHAAEARYRSLVEQIPAITFTAALDVPGNLLYVSPQIQRLGFSPDEWLANPDGVLNCIHPDDQARVFAAFAHSYETAEPLRCEYRLLTRDGEPRWFLDEARVVHDAAGTPLCLQGVLIDITEDKRREAELESHRHYLEILVAERTGQLEKQTVMLRSANVNLVKEIDERRQTEQTLRQSEARFRLLLDSAGEGIYGLDSEGRCTFVNEAALTMLGYARDELLGRETHSLIHHSHADGSAYPAEECPIYDAFHTGQPTHGLVELLWRKDGSSFPAEYSAQPLREAGQEAGRVSGAVVVFHDVAEAQALRHQLSYQATHDALTGLVNRQEFERQLERMLDETRGDGEAYALLYLDLDRFKVVNDTCGHTAGDQLLRQITARLHERLRGRDTLARLGGDEFGVLLEHCPLDQALRIATELRDAAKDYRFVWEGKPFSVSVSIGLVPLSATIGSVSAALAAADAACYAAKEQGRNRVHLYQPDDALLAQQHAQMQWVSRLTHALDANRFRLYQQVIAPLGQHGQGRPHHEVLLRLLDEEGRVIEPMAFVPAAERYNLMPAIDRWVVREVISRHAVQQRHAPVAERPIFAVNLSSSSLADERLAGFVCGLLAEHGVPADMLCFEISETAAIANLSRATEFIQALKREGCLFALDNFGSCMSSFAYLKQLPVDFLKIDGSFIRTIAEDSLTRAMAEAINRVAHVMAIETVAECAESAPILALLKELGVDHAQGYALERPQPLPLPEADAPAPSANGYGRNPAPPVTPPQAHGQ